MREIEVKFSISGWATQTIQLSDDCNLSAQEIEDRLNRGEIATSIQEDGELILMSGGQSLETIGKVIDVDNNCQYEDFEAHDMGEVKE